MISIKLIRKASILATAISIAVPFAVHAVNQGLASDKIAQNPAANTQTICIAMRQLTCIDASTTRVLWSNELEGDGSEFYLDDQSLIVADNHKLSHYDPKTGERHWQLTFEMPVFSPVVDQEHIYLSGEQGVVRKIDRLTGEISWHTRIGSGWMYSAAGQGNALLVAGQDHTLYVLDKLDGSIQATQPLHQEPVYRPVINQHNQLIVSTFGNQTLAFDAASGKPVWQQSTTAPVFNSQRKGNKLIEASMDGAITVRDAQTGGVIWSKQPFQSPHFKLASGLSAVAAMDEKGQLFAYDIETGVVLAEVLDPEIDPHYFAPILRDKQLFLVASSGRINRVELKASTIEMTAKPSTIAQQ